MHRRLNFAWRRSSFFRGTIGRPGNRWKHSVRQHADSPLNAYVLAYLGEIALTGGDGPCAESLYREAIERYRNGPLEQQCRFGLAHALELQGDSDEAIRFYRFLVENDQGDLADDAQLQIGSLLYKKGEYDQAVDTLADFESAFPESPLQASAGYWVGMSYLASARYSEAVAALETAAGNAAETDLAPAIEFSWADALNKSGNKDAARTHFENVRKTWPESAWADDALQVLAQAAFQADDLEGSVRLGREFADKYADSPLRPVAAQTLGRALLKQEQFEAAIEVFEGLVAGQSAGSAATATESEAPTPDAGQTPAETASARANQYFLCPGVAWGRSR